MRRTIVTLLSLAALVAAGTVQAAPSPAEFTDPTGDAGPGPDITRTVVSVDDAGLISFRIEIPNRPTLIDGQFVAVEIDADANADSGSSSGTEVIVLGGPGGFGLGRWNGSAFGDPVRPASLGFSYNAGIATLTINRSDLGLAGDTLRFWAGTSDNTDDPANFDPAPEFGLYTYSLSEKPTIRSIVVPASALLPQPGKTVSARGIQLRLTNDEIVNPDTITCTLKVAGKTLKPLAGGCKWKIPATAAGKRGTLTVELTYESETVTQRYPVKVGR